MHILLLSIAQFINIYEHEYLFGILKYPHENSAIIWRNWSEKRMKRSWGEFIDFSKMAQIECCG